MSNEQSVVPATKISNEASYTAQKRTLAGSSTLVRKEPGTGSRTWTHSVVVVTPDSSMLTSSP